jgi:hypothetical protein
MFIAHPSPFTTKLAVDIIRDALCLSYGNSRQRNPSAITNGFAVKSQRRQAMTKNVSDFDRLVRLTMAAVLAVLIFIHAVHGWTAVILGVLAAVFLVTALTRTCPLYALLRLSTVKRKK